jgi:hypothetical protein
VTTVDASRAASGIRARAVGLAAVVAFAAVALARLRGSTLAATWFYDVAWWSYIALADAIVHVRTGRSLLLSRTRSFALLALWSAAFWLAFEVANLRLQNWYYVGLPRRELERAVGFVVSFATVLPGILETQALLAAFGAFATTRCTPLALTQRAPLALTRRARAISIALGVACAVLPLCFPRYAFPLIWGVVPLVAEPWLAARGERGLLTELAHGRPALLLQLLAAGFACGLLWEAWNVCASARWIYSVPFFEDTKLFEMPLAGFLGFPPFALECYSFARVLVATGLVPEWETERACADARAARDASADARPRTARAAIGALAALAFCAPAIALVERITVRSTLPMVDEIAGVSPGFADACRRDGILTTRELVSARRDRELVRLSAEFGAERMSRWIEAARLMEVRGLGARGARWLESAGIDTVAELARADPDGLSARFASASLGPPPTPTPAEVRTWVRGARTES